MVRQATLRTQAQFRRGTYSFPCYRSSTIVILFLNLQYLPHSCHNSIRACISRFVHVDLHTPNRLIVCQYSDVNGAYNCHLYATVYVNDKSALALLAHVSSSPGMWLLSSNRLHVRSWLPCGLDFIPTTDLCCVVCFVIH